MVDDDDHFTCPSIEPAVQFFCMRIIVSYLHISLHVLPCLALLYLLLSPFSPSLLSNVLPLPRCPSSSDPAKRVTEWLRQPHVLLPSSSSTTNLWLPPSRAAFVSPHLLFFGANAVAVIVFRSFLLFLPVLFLSCLVILSSHFTDDEETEERSDQSGSTGCVEQEEQ